jgi:aminoglycoside 6-adenylyltransferase
LVVGSYARDHHPADEWSDVDLLLFTTNPSLYASRSDWLTQLGDVWLTQLNVTGWGDPEWFVVYDGGLKVDIVLAPINDHLSVSEACLPYLAVVQRGAKVLFDKQAPEAKLELGEAVISPPPSKESFRGAINNTWLAALRAAKFLRRGDLWRAKQTCDCELKQRLLLMLEWHARAQHGAQHDTWHDGRYLSEWADPAAVAALPQTFALYAPADLWRALFVTLDVFRRLARETAARFNYPYPDDVDAYFMAWLHKTEKAE